MSQIRTPVSGEEIKQAFSRILKKAALLGEAEAVFCLRAEGNNLISLPFTVGLEGQEIENLTIPIEGTISGEVFLTQNPKIWQNKSKELPFKLRNCLTIPLTNFQFDEQGNVISSQKIGVLEVINKKGNKEFNEEDIKFLMTMARQIAQIVVAAGYYQVVAEKEKLRAALASLPLPWIILDLSGTIIEANLPALQIFALSEKRPLSYQEAIKDENLNNFFRDALEGIYGEVIEWEIKGKIFQVQSARIAIEEKNLGVVIVFLDITEIRQLEKLKTDFVATASHELRTPLTSIFGFTNTILQDPQSISEENLEFVKIINAEAKRMNYLIANMLSISRIQEGRALDNKPKILTLRPIIETVVNLQKHWKKESHIFEIDCQEDLVAFADENMLNQIFVNLISNATKFSPKGGKISVKAETSNDFVTISISDQGMGIPEDKIGHIFERFYRVNKGNIPGTGIGLSVTKHLVELHQGKIWVESQERKGTTFYFTLPKAP